MERARSMFVLGRADRSSMEGLNARLHPKLCTCVRRRRAFILFIFATQAKQAGPSTGGLHCFWNESTGTGPDAGAGAGAGPGAGRGGSPVQICVQIWVHMCPYSEVVSPVWPAPGATAGEGIVSPALPRHFPATASQNVHGFPMK